MRFLSSFVFSSVLVLASACGPLSEGGGDGGDDADASTGTIDAPPNNADAYVPPEEEACNKMDIVFVIDDSGSMGEEQGNLNTNFPAFAQVLETYQTQSGDLLDYRVAVTTTGRDLMYTLEPLPLPLNEPGENGKFLQKCGMTRPWIERADGNLASTFPCVASVGTSGPGFEMPLMMLDWAFNDRVADGSNAGFLRDDALLGIVMLTDEDDCSFEGNNFNVGILDNPCTDSLEISQYLTMLDTVKSERGRWAAAVIAGETMCTSSLGMAEEASRLKDFIAQTGDNGIFSSICQGDLAGALEDTLTTFDAACRAFPPIE